MLLILSLNLSWNVQANETMVNPTNYALKRIKPSDILGIGSAEVDIITFVSNEYIKRNLTISYGIQKNSFSITDRETWETLKKHMDNYTIVPSGQVASLLSIYSSLGGKSALNAMLADDEYSSYLLENFGLLGIDLINKSKLSQNQTKANLVFVAEDGGSTHVGMLNNNGIKITQKDIKYHLIKDYKMVVAESGLWDGGTQSKAIIRAYNIAEKVGTQRVLLISDVKYAKQYGEDFLKLMNKLDIIIANEASMKELTHANNLESLIEKLKKLNKLIVFTRGKDGAVIVDGQEVYFIEANIVDKKKVIDKSGSHEAFAAGFLYGLTHNMSIPKSGELAAKVASYIIQQIGRKPQHNLSEIINEDFSN